jgi:hypothetical protein
MTMTRQPAKFGERKSAVRPATCLDAMRTFFCKCRARLLCGAEKWTEFPQAKIFSHVAYWVIVQGYEYEDETSHLYKFQRFKREVERGKDSTETTRDDINLLFNLNNAHWSLNCVKS